MQKRSFGLATGAACAALWLMGCGEEREETVDPQGRETTLKTDALKAGAAALQGDAPLSGMDVYLVGFHPMKEDPSHQMEAHHYCRQTNQDFAQCALFDGNTDEANLTGIEYIISEQLSSRCRRRSTNIGIPTITRSCPANSWRQGYRPWRVKS